VNDCLGVSFSHRQAAHLGLDPMRAFDRLLEMGFRLVRVSCYWDEIDGRGYGRLDALVEAAERTGVGLLVTVGTKAMRWPEFYIPARLDGRPSSSLRESALEVVATTVRRYRSSSAVEAWQVENEPLNRSGPRRRLVPKQLLEAELDEVRRLDGRPIVVNAFRHFRPLVDRASQACPWANAEAAILRLLNPGEVLGLDLYRRIALTIAGRSWLSSAPEDWAERAERVAAAARASGRRAWVVEAQAEPWGPGSLDPGELAAIRDALRGRGFERIVLWGAEHWLHREAQGDPSWTRAARSLLA
jgi:hypothetical protein